MNATLSRGFDIRPFMELRNSIVVEPAVGSTPPWAGVTSFGFAQDRLCTQ
jgi:hypothetical protein